MKDLEINPEIFDKICVSIKETLDKEELQEEEIERIIVDSNMSYNPQVTELKVQEVEVTIEQWPNVY